MEFIVRECPNNGILGGPFEKTITAYIGQQHSLAEISIEQFGERIITVHTVEDASIYDLHHLYFDLKRNGWTVLSNHIGYSGWSRNHHKHSEKVAS